MTIDLVKIKKTRKKPQKGDVFVVQTTEGVYFFGKVIKAALETNEAFVRGGYVVFMYEPPARSEDIPEELNLNKLIMPPFITSHLMWSHGYCKTIANIEVTPEEESLDYGFVKSNPFQKVYVDELGNKLNHVPKIIEEYGLCNSYHIELGIEKYLESGGHFSSRHVGIIED